MTSTSVHISNEGTEAVIVYFNDLGLSDSIHAGNDLIQLEEQLIEAIEARGLGEYDGNEIGPSETALYMYGADAEQLFSAIEPILRSNLLCRKARVVIRRGEPGAPERTVDLARS